MPEDTTEQLKQAMLRPKRMEVDGKVVETHDLDDLVALDKYLESKKAARRGRLGVRFVRTNAGGGPQ
jgi:hypothetical protein